MQQPLMNQRPVEDQEKSRFISSFSSYFSFQMDRQVVEWAKKEFNVEIREREVKRYVQKCLIDANMSHSQQSTGRKTWTCDAKDVRCND